MTSRAWGPRWRGWLRWLTWQAWCISALLPTYESETHFWVCLVMLSSVSLLINRLTSLNELHVIKRVLSRLQMKTHKRVCEDAGKKPNSAVLSLNCNISRSQRRAWIQLHTLVEICCDIKPSKFELSPQCSSTAIWFRSSERFFRPTLLAYVLIIWVFGLIDHLQLQICPCKINIVSVWLPRCGSANNEHA